MSRLIDWFARNHISANLMMGVMFIGGLAALASIPQKIFPDVDLDIISISAAYQERRHKPSLAADRRECPHVAVAELAQLLLWDVLLLRVDEAPNLVHLEPLARQITHDLI